MTETEPDVRIEHGDKSHAEKFRELPLWTQIVVLGILAVVFVGGGYYVWTTGTFDTYPDGITQQELNAVCADAYNDQWEAKSLFTGDTPPRTKCVSPDGEVRWVDLPKHVTEDSKYG